MKRSSLEKERVDLLAKKFWMIGPVFVATKLQVFLVSKNKRFSKSFFKRFKNN
jgi:hypothetical protein